MATVMMGWELGEGLGHVQKLLQVARPLQAQGHRPVFVLYNGVESWPLFQGTDFPVLQAPVYLPGPAQGDRAASSFADILALRGWDSVDTLLPLVLAWQRLLELIQPRLIVGDFSPTLCLAAFRTLPIVLVGSWFSLPPGRDASFPLLLPGHAPLVSQEKMLSVVQDVQRRRQQPVPASLPEILANAACFPAVLLELDAYAALRTESTWNPLEPLLAPPAPPPAPHFFAYLSAEFPQVEAILTEMALTGCRGTAYLRGIPVDMGERLMLQGLEVLEKPAAMNALLAHASVIVHHGGLGTTQAALAAGRPQILFPQHLEQFTTAQLARKLGVAVNLVGSVTPQGAARALRQVMQEPRFAENANAQARRIHSRPRRDTLSAILECCRRHLRENGHA